MAFAANPWGKFDETDGTSHHLIHHCADVVACFAAITALPVIRQRLETAAQMSLSPTVMARLFAIVFLHDVGKLHPGFLAKGWPDGIWHEPPRGHVKEGASLLLAGDPRSFRAPLDVERVRSWANTDDLLYASLSHHGRPLTDFTNEGRWISVSSKGIVYDPFQSAVQFGAAMRAWFPLAFSDSRELLPSAPAFQHLFAGLVALADWLGSDRKFFPFVATFDHGYFIKAQAIAARIVGAIGLDVEGIRSMAAGRTSFLASTGFSTPNAQQALVGGFSLDEQLIILEAETGAGKTEAAFWRFAKLFEAGLVDGLYFALPTRAAAVQIHGRINRMLQTFLPPAQVAAILAVPGYIKAGEIEGVALPHWRVLWDDDGKASEDERAARWAAESSKRYLAAQVAVGTVDQAMLAVLQVKHAHLRGAALTRNLLVIDEVHASDHYMTEIQSKLIEMQLSRGGHVMLMSATLGSAARARWLHGRRRGLTMSGLAEAVAAPYPAVWGKMAPKPAHDDDTQGETRQKSVAMRLVSTMAPVTAADLALHAARAGARVLVIRNTVSMAVKTWEAVLAAGGEEWLFSVDGIPTLHHSRFAPEDRKRLDEAVERVLSPRRKLGRGLIVIGTQTVEQSLDIDADMLISDLCPIDVLLQRLGRLHRHCETERHQDFIDPVCYVMTLEGGLERLLSPSFENGLGAWADSTGAMAGVYQDVSILELTRRLVQDRPMWIIPQMNRLLVESALHDDRIEALHQELGGNWESYRTKIKGGHTAEAGAAKNVVCEFHKAFSNAPFLDDEASIRTRLGGEGAKITFDAPVNGPFGKAVSGLTLPNHWSCGIKCVDPIVPKITPQGLSIDLDRHHFIYDRRGVSRPRNG